MIFYTQIKKTSREIRIIKVWELKDSEKRELFEVELKKKIPCFGVGKWKNLKESILSVRKEICMLVIIWKEGKSKTDLVVE